MPSEQQLGFGDFGPTTKGWQGPGGGHQRTILDSPSFFKDVMSDNERH